MILSFAYPTHGQQIMNNDDDSEDSKYHPLIVILFGCIERNTVNWKTDGKQELFISEY